jgi:hypothetical protein
LVLRAAVKTAIGKYGYEVIGFKDGYQGLVLRWASIDNDESRDLDQLTVAAAAPDDKEVYPCSLRLLGYPCLPLVIDFPPSFDREHFGTIDRAKDQ